MERGRSRMVGSKCSRAPSEVRKLAESKTKCTSSEWHECRWRNSFGAGSTKLRSLKAALAVLSPEESGARAAHATVQRAKEEQKPMQRSLQSGRSSCQGVQVGESFGRIGRHHRGRGRGNQVGPRESQSSCTREASYRVDCRLQGVHRSRRKTIGEVGCAVDSPHSSVGNMS